MSCSVLFVCLGNICRSPAAEGIARKLNEQLPLFTHIDSAGTSGYHEGAAPHNVMQSIAIQRGYSLKNMSSRQVQVSDFKEFDYIVAMDSSNFQDLKMICPVNHRCKLVTLLEFEASDLSDVPDPYYGGPQGFEDCFTIVENGIRDFFTAVETGLI